MIFADLKNIPPYHSRVAMAVRNYMTSHKLHDIRDLERCMMDCFEEEQAACHDSKMGVYFKWVTISKQHQPPFYERYCVAVYSQKNLMVSVFENPSFQGKK